MVNRKYIGLLLLALGCGSIALGFHNYNSLSAEEFKLYLIRTESAIVFIFFSAGFRLLKHKANWASHPTLTVICLLGTLLCYGETMPIWLTFSVSPILLSIAVNSLDNLPKIINWALSCAPLRYMGIYSYSIYIWQQFFYEYYWAFAAPKILTAFLAITIGILSYHLLENPVRRMVNSRWSKNPTYHKLDKNQ
jgi:peptidoglycan/LPS O-acetylase OafA/YrhL